MPRMHDLPALTQKQMAARLGVSQALVSRALSGRAGEIGASRETVEKICRMAAEWNYQPSATAREFERDLVAIRAAVTEFGLPENLKISVHSGSDKFSLYAPMRELLEEHGAGLHLKTSGTTPYLSDENQPL